MNDQKNLDEKYRKKILHNKRSLLVEITATIGIAIMVLMIGMSNVVGQAGQYASDVKSDYDMLMEEYVRLFDTAWHQVTEKIKEDPSFEEMDAWMKSQDDAFMQTMGAAVYDGICFTYKGDMVRSWDYGDYSGYDVTSRPWYQAALAAGGDTVIVPPYVTFLDSQFYDDDSYILLSIVKKYNEEISVDYDIKIMEIEALLQERHELYRGTRLLLLDPDGYVLSSNNRKEFARNIDRPDDVLTESVCRELKSSYDHSDRLRLVQIDGQPSCLFASRDQNGNLVCMIIPFFSLFIHDFLAITLIVIFLILFELYLYRKNVDSLREFKGRDERLTVITHAAFAQRLYVDLATMEFYGNSEAEQLCFGDHNYELLYQVFKDRLMDEEEQAPFEEFLSPAKLKAAMANPYQMEKMRFLLKWKLEEGYKPRTLEICRLASVIDGKETIGIVCRDVSEDAEILKNALNQAESASKAKGDFMSRMSHEIRTPLNAVIGYIDIAKDEKEDQEKVDHCLEQSSVAARHLLSIINDVLDISSIESGRMKIASEDFDLTQLVHSLTTIVYAQAKKKNVEFDVNIEGLTEEWVIGDSLRLNQILLNLLSNAVKFTPENGKISLNIRQAGIHQNKVHLQFQVTDSGIGMSPEYKNRIFQPFEQESADTARNYGGTGLGLSISFNLVKLMGGTINVDSKQGQGTTFTVLLAFGRSKEKASGHLSTDSFKNLRALVVDDEENACEYAKKLLDRCGVACDTVTSGKKALRRVRDRKENGHPYDLCILDWSMAEMDGLETAKQIRQLCGTDLPIIIATSYDYSSIIDEAKVAGINKIISKPLFQSTLFDLLVNTYGKYAPAKEGGRMLEKRKIDFGGKRILLAEDNEMNMEIAVSILTKAGLQVTPVVNGKEALDTLTASEPGTFDAILMDIQMPVMDGYEATKEIRKSAHPQAKTIPIIAMTANAFTSDVTEALAAGMNDHISKPVSYERLFDALSRLTTKK